eukprot:403335876
MYIKSSSLKIVGLATILAATQIVAQKLYTDSISDMDQFLTQLLQTYPQSNGRRSEIIQCNFPGMCPDGTVKDSCQWERIFYVQVTDPATRMIQVVTNSLPNHCYYVYSNPPVGIQYITEPASQANTYQFKMRFNLPISDMYQFRKQTQGPYVNSKLEDQTSVDISQCNYIWASSGTIDENVYYDEATSATWSQTNFNTQVWNVGTSTPYLNLANPDSVVGIALNGVFIFGAVNEFGYDAFFPIKYGEKLNPQGVEADICLGSVYQSTYKYHMFSPCILPNSLQKISAPCDNDCQKQIAAHSISTIPDKLKTIFPIGLAKDGRVIYGPYNSDQTLWQPCDVDICNGRTFQQDYYGYVSTMFFPYMIGCWGPGTNVLKLNAECGGIKRICASSDSLSGISLIFSSIFVATTSYLFA